MCTVYVYLTGACVVVCCRPSKHVLVANLTLEVKALGALQARKNVRHTSTHTHTHTECCFSDDY